MSTPSIKSPRSPPVRWLSNDDGVAEARKSSDRGTAEPAVTSDDDEQKTTHQSMNNPVDENLFDSAPSQPLDDTANTPTLHDDADDQPYQEPSTGDLLPPPDFRPFFVLIEDPETGEHQHPTVHYVFSDDDPEILTSAALDAVGRHQDRSQAAPEEIEERYVMVNMAADGKTVTSTSSMSVDWQGLKSAVSQAPSWGEGASSANRGLMLKISGQDNRPSGSWKDRSKKQHHGSLDELVKGFSDRLDRLDEVLGRSQTTTDDRETTS